MSTSSWHSPNLVQILIALNQLDSKLFKEEMLQVGVCEQKNYYA